MEDQIKHEQRRYENLKSAIVKEEMAEEHLYQPKINAKSLQMLERAAQDPVELSKMKKVQKQQTYLQERAAQEKFKPQINAISQQLNRGVDLMQAAARRQ